MAKRPYFYQDLSWTELRDRTAADPVVVLPVGTTEQHGPHLPLATDYLTAGTIARAAVEQVSPRALLMEAVPYSFNEHHMDFPGTITIDVHTILDYIAQIGTSVAHHGFRHIVLFNGHGSNVPFLDVAARMITNRPTRSALSFPGGLCSSRRMSPGVSQPSRAAWPTAARRKLR